MLPGLCCLQLQILIFFERIVLQQERVSSELCDFPHLTCQPINCILEDALVAKTIDLSGGFLPSSSPMVLEPNEWLKYQRGEGHTLSGIPDSSDLFTVRCLDGDHTMTHCKSVQCGDPPVIAYATPLGGCFCHHHLRKAGRVPARSWISCGIGAQVWNGARTMCQSIMCRHQESP